MRKLVIILLVIIMCINIGYVSAEPTVIVFNGDIDHVLVDSNDVYTLRIFQKQAKEMMAAAHQMAEQARFLGYPEYHPVIVLAGKEWTAWNKDYKYYTEQINKYDTKMNAYPVAAAVWFALMENGYSECAAAGIIGNMMTECGHQTLTLDYTAYSSSGEYYGLCQWSKKYYPEMYGASLEAQINYLLETTSAYRDYDDPAEAAIAFAKGYEKCTSASYEKRKTNAWIAYDYFFGN